MPTITWKKIIPYAACVGLFLVLSYAFVPQVFQGKVINQSDISSWEGMSKEARDYNQTHDDPTLWTNAMFSGMPTVAITMPAEGDYTDFLYHGLLKGAAPATYLFISLLGGFLLFLALGVNPWLAALGGVAITFCSYNLQIIQVGHITKMVAIAFMPWVLAALVFAYRRNALLGAGFFAMAVGFQVKANHPQITYYLLFLLLALIIGECISAVKTKQFRPFLKTSCLLLVAGLLGAGTFTNKLLPTYEYAKYTMRGGSELTDESGEAGRDGLQLDYATQWCYGPGESFNMMIPDFKGGASVGALGKDSHTYQFLQKAGYNANQAISSMPLYWGPQPFTAGPMYMGAIIIFLFVLGLFLVKGPLKWALAAVMALALFLSWGSHFMGLTEFFFNYVPMYNKFRTVSMILVLWQVGLPLLGIVALHAVLNGTYPPAKVNKALTWSLALTGGLCALMALIPSLAGSFSGSADASLPRELLPALVSDRKALLRADAFRSALLIGLSAVVIWLFLKKKIKKQGLVIACLGVLLLVDYWPVAKRYLNETHFVTKNAFQNQFATRPVDKAIKEDPDLYYRVLDLSVNTFNDAIVSYHHKSVGGYSAAKLQRYQDVIDHYLAPEIQGIMQGLQRAETYAQATALLQTCPVLNMLNAKYIILGAESSPLLNPYVLGNAWGVSRLVPVTTPDQEIARIGTVDLSNEAVMTQLPPDWERLQSEAPSQARVTLVSYEPNALEYQAQMGDKEGLVVFGEVFYPEGWKAWIDETEVPIYRANYIARALVVPAGEHTIKFTFLPPSYTKGKTLSRICSSLVWVMLLVGTAVTVAPCVRKQQRKKDTEK